MNAIKPCLWCNGDAETAAHYYAGIFSGSSVGTVSRYGENMPFPAGTAMMVEFTLRGQPFQALNGGPQFPFTQAISLSADCADQAELDHIWDSLVADGGKPVQCGWLKDRYGVSWQLVPAALGTMQRAGSREQVGRMMQALMGMVKLDIAALEAAYEGA